MDKLHTRVPVRVTYRYRKQDLVLVQIGLLIKLLKLFNYNFNYDLITNSVNILKTYSLLRLTGLTGNFISI